jgi:signal peptidase I
MTPRLRLLVLVVSVPVIAAIAMFLLNPFGVPSWDPRGRVLGVIPYRIPSDSMAPTIVRGEIVVTCTAAYLNSRPERGDIVVFKSPENGSAFIKRVVAREGDKVEFTQSQFLLNQVAQREAFVQGKPQYEPMAEVVPKASVFVVGDNREHSLDSRHFGPIPENTIIGKVCAGL